MSFKAIGRGLIEILVLLGLAVLLSQGIRTFLIEPYLVPTGSMIPTIELRDRVLANKLPFWFGKEPQRGDVVVFDDPTGDYPQLIKRVVAVAGDVVDLKDGAFYLNGEPVDEWYVHGKETMPLSTDIVFPLQIDEGYVLMMGDNRLQSLDGRAFGPTPISEVNGRAFWTYWPPDRFGALK